MEEQNLENVSLIMNAEIDQVAIAKTEISKGVAIHHAGSDIVIKEEITRGNRFALRDIPAGEFVCQYGYAFGLSKGIKSGELISIQNIDNKISESDINDFEVPPITLYDEELAKKTFQGFLRSNGKVGTRNYYAVIPTSMCAAETASQIVSALKEDVKEYGNIDGIVALNHTEGCGCDSTLSIDRLLLIIKDYVEHPNVGGVFLLDLGCEQTNYERVNAYLKDALCAITKPVDWLTIEESGGVRASREKSIELIKSRLPLLESAKRETCSLAKLIVGTECGASDTFSGITANPLIGNVVDKVIKAGGAAILSEVTEMVGTFNMLLPRFRNVEIAEKFSKMMQWYVDLGKKLGHDLEGNLVPKNIEGGLINIFIKSLGAVIKGGTTAIEDVLDYGEPITKSGLSIMQGPGGDLESVTGIVASGANVVCFSTGQGTPTGNAICPVVKIASNNEVYQKLSEDIDFNGGRLLTGEKDFDQLGDELLDMVIDVASGKETKSEISGQKQFQIWTAGKLPL